MENETASAMLSATPTGVVEEAVIDHSRWGAVRALFERGMSKKQIARQLGLDPKTVRKWLRQPFELQRRPKRGSILEPWQEWIGKRAPEVGFNAAVLLRELRSDGYGGSYQSLRRYLQPLRQQAQGGIEPTPRFETAPGQQAQVDWGSLGVWLGDELVRVHMFVMVLGYSRRIFARAYRHERIGALLDGHARAFAHFGGRTHSLLYDNPRTIVLKKDEQTGEVLEWNATFKDRMDFYGIEPKLCRYYRAQTKGKVESGVKYVKRNALAGRRFRDLDELNAWLDEWSLQVADQRVHGTTHEVPAERFARHEAAALIPTEARPLPTQARKQHRRVPSDAYVTVETNRYPVPTEWVGRSVEVSLEAEVIQIQATAGQVIRHPRLEGKHKVARWMGEPRQFARPHRGEVKGAPQFDPFYTGVGVEVQVRSLSEYEALIQEVTT